MFLALFLVGFPTRLEAQIEVRNFQELDSLQQIEPRPIVFFIYTDWCKYCQAMENTSFQNENVQNTLNQYFYFIQLNAESKKDIAFQNYVFQFKPSGNGAGIHELAEQLASIDGKVSFPTMCVLNPNLEIVFQNAGFMNAETMLLVIKELASQREK